MIEGTIKYPRPEQEEETGKPLEGKRHRPAIRKRPPADYGKRRRSREKAAKASKRRNRK